MFAVDNAMSSVIFPVKLITSFTTGLVMLNVVLTTGGVVSHQLLLELSINLPVGEPDTSYVAVAFTNAMQ